MFHNKFVKKVNFANSTIYHQFPRPHISQFFFLLLQNFLKNLPFYFLTFASFRHAYSPALSVKLFFLLRFKNKLSNSLAMNESLSLVAV